MYSSAGCVIPVYRVGQRAGKLGREPVPRTVNLPATAANGAVTPTVRSEGYTELTGDIVIACVGGAAPVLGTPIQVANIVIFLNTAVTSRLLQATSAGNASEALLLIDEPGSGLGGYGPSVPQTLCTTPSVGAGPGGCSQIVGTFEAHGWRPESLLRGCSALLLTMPVTALVVRTLYKARTFSRA